MRKKRPKGKYSDPGSQRVVFFTPRIGQDKGKILLAIVREE